MRAKKLILSAFGPFSDKTTIDFEKLGDKGLYLIAGDTGAGKTTIFDAITFALYGSSSGGLRESKMFRSQYADKDTPTYVEFTFSYRGAEYRIHRNPAYMRPKKKGQGEIEEAAKAILYLENGETISVTRDVNEYIVNLLSITESQFKQIAMIAQGDFLKLLHASNDEKRELFRKIFSTDKFNKLEEAIREKKADVDGKFSEIKADFTKINEDVEASEEDKILLGSYSYDKPDLYIEKLNQIIGQDKGKSQDLKAKREANLKEIYQIKESITKAKDYLQNQAEIENCKAKLAEEEGALLHNEQIKEQNKDLAQKIENIKGKISVDESILPSYDQLEEYTFLIEKLEENINKDSKKCRELAKEIERGRDSLSSMEIFIEENEDKGSNLLQHQGEFNALSEKILKLGKLKSKYIVADKLYKEVSSQEANLAEKNLHLDHLQRKRDRVEAIFYNSQAGLLAKELSDGEPCPVCGSTSHPKPALLSDETIEKSDLEKLNKQVEKARKDREDTWRKLAASKESLKFETTFIEEQLKDFGQYGPWNEGEQDIDSLYINLMNDKTALDKLLKEEEGLVKEVKSFKIQVKDLKMKLDSEGKELVDLDKSISALKSKLESKDEFRKELLSKLEFESKFQASKNIENMKAQLNDLIEKRDRIENKINENLKNIASLKSLIENLSAKQLEGLDLDYVSLGEEAAKKERDSEKILAEEKVHDAALANNLKQLNRYKASYESFKELEGDYMDINDIYRTVAGQISGKEKVQFEVYVQMTYFDEIIVRANRRFDQMTSGQYQLRRKEGASDNVSQSGLELEILDKFSAMPRNIKTLSGGESFKAALSLALGLSDTVQMHSGGVQIDSMFIDEGFGSLDKESLTQVMHALSDLTKSNKMIGIISHVESLKDTIDKKILVEKDNKGISHVHMIY